MRFREIRGWLLRLFGMFNRKHREREFTEELESHLAFHIEDNLRAGMSPEEARRQALIKLGGVTLTQERHREQRGLPMLETLWHDLRFGARLLKKQPGFTLVAVLTLALGIGANTAIFTVVNGLLLRPLPYPEAGRLAVVDTTVRRERVEVRAISYPDFVSWRDQNTVFEQIAARSSQSFSLLGGDEPERVSGELVSANYFSLLGVPAAYGRTFLPEEDRTPGTHRVAMVGYGLWQRRFGGTPNLVGQTIQLSDGNYTVVGVMPEGFRGISDQAELWLPMMMVSAARETGDMQTRNQRWLATVARLKHGVGLSQAQAEMDTIARRLEQSYPDTNAYRGTLVTPLVSGCSATCD